MVARAGAVKWISKKVVMNGVEMWAAFVKYGSAQAPKDSLSEFGSIVNTLQVGGVRRCG